MKIFLLLELLVQNKHLFTDIMEHILIKNKFLMNLQFLVLDILEVFVYRYNGTHFNQEQIFDEPSIPGFGSTVLIYQNVIVVGTDGASEVFVYRYNGTHFNQEQNLIRWPPDSGSSVSIYEDVIVVGSTDGASEVFVYRYNGSHFNQEQILSESISDFGYTVSIYEDAIAVGTYGESKVFTYRYNGSYFNQEQIFSEPSISNFGYSVSIYQDLLVVGTDDANQAFIYRYNEPIWNLEQILSEPSISGFGRSVSSYENFVVVGTDDDQALVYELILIPQVNAINCSSLFSSFDCYWDEIQISNLKYQINYGVDWIDIDTPILEDGNVYYQEFNSSIYDNITGNEYYSIQIQACDKSSMKCGEPSSSINLITRIDSVQNFELSNPSNYSINATWSYPNVQIIEEIPHLDHYNLSYFNQYEPELISFISVDNSSISYLLNDIECGNDYNISICGCRTNECEGEDQGEISESTISLLFEEVSNLICSISYSIDINCTWDQPINCSIPSYYNFSYQAISQDDSGNYQPTQTNQAFTAQLPNQEYQINVSACDSNGRCGDISTFPITTDSLPTAPTIYEWIPKIEEIELNFTKLTHAQNYSISLDNQESWQNFTTLNLSGNEVIGTINGISGNVEYNISIRGCADLNCEIEYLGEPSSIISTKAKLGNITSLNCLSLICGFECEWDPLILSTGLEAYSFTYNSSTICLSNLTTNYSISEGLNSGDYYEISIYSSADLNCSFNEYSGINSSTSIIINYITSPTENSTNTTVIVIGIIIPVIVISGIIISIILIKQRIKKSKNKRKAKAIVL
ncbi:hypothetical protein M0811_11409 [Anaeramoeba ignava]|uniref:Fibronectin type-III domain-containing protein n=1 Tax=Anaeramoeba ignava TaxID=1746090 RepID=A0A9Q0R7A4_ANAIG|nr:hypothetical protein M0811_11409 [Anaeramoeba ignava]